MYLDKWNNGSYWQFRRNLFNYVLSVLQTTDPSILWRPRAAVIRRRCPVLSWSRFSWSSLKQTKNIELKNEKLRLEPYSEMSDVAQQRIRHVLLTKPNEIIGDKANQWLRVILQTRAGFVFFTSKWFMSLYSCVARITPVTCTIHRVQRLGCPTM